MGKMGSWSLWLMSEGRAGPLCANCDRNFRATNKLCVECKNVSTEQMLAVIKDDKFVLTCFDRLLPD